MSSAAQPIEHRRKLVGSPHRTIAVLRHLALIWATIVAAANAVMGTALAWVIVRYRFPGRRVLSTVVDLPLAVPTLVWGVMILVLYGPNSFLGKAAEAIGIRVLFTPLAIVL